MSNVIFYGKVKEGTYLKSQDVAEYPGRNLRVFFFYRQYLSCRNAILGLQVKRGDGLDGT